MSDLSIYLRCGTENSNDTVFGFCTTGDLCPPGGYGECLNLSQWALQMCRGSVPMLVPKRRGKFFEV